MGLARTLLRKIERRLPEAQGGVTVLAYHLVGAGTGSAVDLPRGMFRAQMEALARTAEVVSLDDALCATDAGRRVVLTFDDAYENFRTEAWPVLRELGLPALLYVPVAFVDKRGRAPIRGTDHLPPLSWSALREMQREGLTIGSHSVAHVNLLRLSADEAEREIADSKKLLEDRLGVAVESFCYPQAKWAPRLEPAVRATYRTATVGGGKKLHPGKTDRYRIPRVSVRRDMPGDVLPLLSSPVCLEELAGDLTRRFRA